MRENICLRLKLGAREAEVAHGADEDETHEDHEVAEEDVTFDFLGIRRAFDDRQAKLMKKVASAEHSGQVCKAAAEHKDFRRVRRYRLLFFIWRRPTHLN